MNEEIIRRALDNLYKTAGITGDYYPESHGLSKDLVLHLKPYNKRFLIEVKKEIRKHQLNHLIDLKRRSNNFLLVAERLTPSLRKQLREESIPYLEANGNIFIEGDDLFLLIDGNKAPKLIKDDKNRAFTKTGLKLVFHFLQDKELIQQNQRDIALTSGVSLGTVPKVIDGLQTSGFLLKNKGSFVWEDREGLLDRWITDYERVLKPKLFRSRYKMRIPWQEIVLNTAESQWGGEPAGDILTNFLRPEEFILFSSESTPVLIKEYALLPDSRGELEVYDKFWKEGDISTAPPIIVYADLIIKNNKRCRETAKIIFDEFIRPNL